MSENRIKGPNFFIVGAAKSGTTSLAHYLATHRQIFISPVKEPHYFSRNDIDTDAIRPAVKKRISNLDLNAAIAAGGSSVIHNYFIREEAQYKSLFSGVEVEIAIGECSTSYLWSPTAASEIHKSIPEARVIAILRNPVLRAYSHFLMEKRLFHYEGSFEEALNQDRSLGHRTWEVSPMYYELGNYFTQLKRYFDRFDKSKIKIIIYDDFKLERERTVFDIFDFLGVEHDHTVDLSKVLNKGSVPRNKLVRWAMKNRSLTSRLQTTLSYKTKEVIKKLIYTSPEIPALKPAVIHDLLEYYKPEIHNLEKLIDRDLSIWFEIGKS